MTANDNLSRLGQAVAGEQDAWLRQGKNTTLRADFLERLGGARKKPVRRKLAVTLAAAAVLAGTVLGVGLPTAWEGKPLSVSVRGVELLEPTAAWWSVEGGHTLPLAFSDGSAVTLAGGTRARVTRVSAVGAELIVEAGKAEVHVTPSHKASWKFNLGPYAVDVLGTQFDVAWQPEADAFELTLHKGRVQISGCLFGAGRTVIAGETVRAFCKAKRLESTMGRPLGGTKVRAGDSAPRQLPGASASGVTDAASSAAEAQARRFTPSPKGQPAWVASAAAAVSGQQLVVTPEAAPSSPTWQSLAATHQYTAALKAAETAGFEYECGRLDAKALVLLADVARYAGNPARARYAYNAVRQRFSRSAEAALSAYFLGRLAFEQQTNYADAVRWFRMYLAENPGGGLAREALGRLMEAEHRLGHKQEAGATARRYLASHPFGPAAPLARQLASP